MNRNEFVSKMNKQLKAVRTEYGCNQERMAQLLGISKKTLVEIEKGRSSLGWSGAVVLSALFGKSQTLGEALGGEPTDILLALAFDGKEPAYGKTMGGKVWWRQIEEYRGYRLQQNILSQHFRALNQEDERVCSALGAEAVRKHLDALLLSVQQGTEPEWESEQE